MNRRKDVTMLDVAAAAGVSVATVSHVINHTAPISAQTTKQVQQAIAQLGYIPREAVQLNLGNRTIGVLVPDISNEFYATIIQGISDEAWKHDYAVMVSNLRHHYSARSAYLRSLMQNNIRGIIMCGGTADDERHIVKIQKKVPVVLCDRNLPGVSIDSVQTDNTNIMRQLIKQLARYGYTRIGYISEDLIMSNSYDRYQGFRLGMEENKLPVDSKWVFLLPELRLSKSEKAYEMMLGILDKQTQLPQVFVCSSDLIAIGVMAALRSKGLKVPRDIGIVGFDNISQAAFTNPPLTTVAQDIYRLGTRSFELLMHRIEQPKRPPEEIILKARIISRSSLKL